MDTRITHLSKNQIEELIDRYYKNEKVKNLIDEFKINVNPNHLFKLFPPKISYTLCPYCAINLEIKYSSRGHDTKYETPECPICGHEDDTLCWCSNCIRRSQLKVTILLDSQLQINENNKVDLDTLDLEEKIYLGALLREGISEDFNYIKPCISFNNPLAPTVAYSREILKSLHDKEIILIHPDSDPECFTNIDTETRNYSFHIYKVKWALNVKKNGLNKLPLIESLLYPTEKIQPDEAYQIWRKISLHESFEYFYHNVTNILGVEYTPGEKTTSVLNDLINDFSVSQIYSIIYRSTNNALRFQVEQNVSRKHAANTIIGNAQSFAERAKVNKWDIQRYNRLKELPESALSKFFFERILKIGFAGFNEKPRLIVVEEENKDID